MQRHAFSCGRPVGEIRSLSLSAVVVTPSLASVSNDQVQSQHIREADGTSGQNTNSGSGVKTGHIQDSAITSAKIADGTITTPDLAASSVTDAKIAGTISLQHLPVGTSADSVAAGDHHHDGTYQQKRANVIVVAKTGGDFSDPIAAVDSIIDASAASPYLVKIMPGVYDFGQATLSMKEFVDIEGAGENATVLSGSPSGSSSVLSGANLAELRLLTVKNQGGTGILLQGVSTSLRNIRVQTITTSPSLPDNVGIVAEAGTTRIIDTRIEFFGSEGQPYAGYGLRVISGDAILDRVSIDIDNVGGSASAINNVAGTLSGRNVTINSNSLYYAILNGGIFGLVNSSVSADQVLFNGGNAQINDSELVNPPPVPGWAFLVSGLSASASTSIHGSKLAGVLVLNYNGTLKCHDNFDAAYDPVSCP